MMASVTLVLGGGGARGLAHVGVLQALKAAEISVGTVVGTSMGGLLGALFCAGVPLDKIEAEVLRLSQPKEMIRMLDPGISSSGLSLKGARIYEFLIDEIGGTIRFDQLQIPLMVLAAELRSGRQLVLRDGSVADAVRATISVPGVFEPVKKGNRILVDGGVLNNLPVDVAREWGAGPVVAVDVLSPCSGDAESEWGSSSSPLVPGFFDEMRRVIRLMITEMTSLRLATHPPDLLVCPSLPAEVSTFLGFQRAGEVIEGGRVAMTQALPELRRLLAKS